MENGRDTTEVSFLWVPPHMFFKCIMSSVHILNVKSPIMQELYQECNILREFVTFVVLLSAFTYV